MKDIFIRTSSLIGNNGLSILQNTHIVLCGCGGVGSYALEALVRSGVGEITVIDNDIISPSNINRQIIALHSTIGQAKTTVAKQRATDINPKIIFHDTKVFLTPDNIEATIPCDTNYIIDAIDFVPAKVAIAAFAQKHNIPLICCLGTGNRLDGTKFEIKDIYDTSGCPLARKMRHELKKANVPSLDVIVSNSKTITPKVDFENGKQLVGSVAYVPSVAGLLCSQFVISKLLENQL